MVLAALMLAFLGAPPTVSLDVREARVENVLGLIADVRRLNLVLGEGVGGTITLRLSRVPWRAALDVVLESRGLVAEELDGILFVEPAAAATERLRARAGRVEARAARGPARTVVIPVHYARAQDLVPIVRGMLGPQGTVTADAHTNVLIVTDAPARVERVKRTLR